MMCVFYNRLTCLSLNNMQIGIAFNIQCSINYINVAGYLLKDVVEQTRHTKNYIVTTNCIV